MKSYNLWTVLFLLVAILSYCINYHPNGNMGMLLEWIGWGLALILFPLLLSRKNIIPLLWGVVVSGLLFAGYGILAGHGWRLTLTFGQPNLAAAFLAFLFIMVVFLFRQYSTPVPKAILSGIGLCLFIGLLLTFSRSAVIALSLALLVGLKKDFISVKILLTGMLLIILLIVGLRGVSMLGGERYRIHGYDLTIGQRVVSYQIAYRMIKEHFFWGVGPGNYSLQSNRYADNTVQDNNILASVHNSWLHLWAELGIFSLITMIVMLSKYFRHALTQDSWLHRLSLVGVVFIIIAGMFENLFVHNLQLGLAFFMVLGYLPNGNDL